METIIAPPSEAQLKYSHSLGILIEWKPNLQNELNSLLIQEHSHSLGILIEWKPLQNTHLPFDQLGKFPLAGDIN